MNRLRRVMARIYDGTAVIGWRAARWPWEAVDWWARARRVAGQAFLGWAAWQITGHYPNMRWVAVLVYCWWAYRLGNPAPRRGEDPAEAQPPAEEVRPSAPFGEDDDPALRRAELVRLLHNLIRQRNGVHLSTVVEELEARGFTHWTVTALKQEYAAAGVTVRDQLFLDGRNRMGVSRDDLVFVPVTEVPPSPPPTDPDQTP